MACVMSVMCFGVLLCKDLVALIQGRILPRRSIFSPLSCAPHHVHHVRDYGGGHQLCQEDGV